MTPRPDNHITAARRALAERSASAVASSLLNGAPILYLFGWGLMGPSAVLDNALWGLLGLAGTVGTFGLIRHALWEHSARGDSTETALAE